MKSENVSFVSELGRRSAQEDCYVCRTSSRGILLAVMDGHGGDVVAKRAAAFVEEEFHTFYSPQKPAEDLLGDLVRGLQGRVDQCQGVGSTLSVAWIEPRRKKVTVAVLGNSPVIVIDDSGRIHLSPEHNAHTNAAEREGAEKRGGFYHDGYVYSGRGTGLQLTRALGDAEFGNILCREPAIYCVENPRKVIVATDGLFAPAYMGERLWPPTEQVIREAKGAADLLAWAATRRLPDNVTILCWIARS
jgi:serine/threonine protein phosphatase PrpC